MSLKRSNKRKLNIREMVLFGVFGGMMYASKVAMQFLPNIHLLGVFIVALTVVYRWKALYPLYTYVLLEGLFAGFNMWWIPYLYIWTLLWGAVMLLPKNMPKKVQPFVYIFVCALHGLLYGTLYAPVQILMFHMTFKAGLAWIVAGLPYDAIHAAGNLVLGTLIMPLIKLIRLSEKAGRRSSSPRENP